MTNIPEFFIPRLEADKFEDTYAKLAKACGRSAPAAGSRIYSIEFDHDGIIWKATVGEQLKGEKHTMRQGRESRTPHSDPAIVLAIFPGEPYVVHTSHGLFTGGSAWANPFYAGKPRRIRLFG